MNEVHQMLLHPSSAQLVSLYSSQPAATMPVLLQAGWTGRCCDQVSDPSNYYSRSSANSATTQLAK
jgi:hypothetical protein